MGLSCVCPEEGAWYYGTDEEFRPLRTKRSRRCVSCAVKLRPGAEVLEIWRTRGPNDDIEERIHGDDYDAVPMASWWMCAACGEIFLNLTAYGYCVDFDESMQEQLEEHKFLEAERIAALTKP